MNTSDAEADLWRFALAVYGAEGVSEECLHLQEHYGADVPVLLCALWMADRGNALNAETIRNLVETIEAWHTEIVKPLRAVRQRMKHGPSPAPSDRTESLRNALKSVELNAERIELAVLAEHVAATRSPEPTVEFSANLLVALSYFADRPIADAAEASRLLAACEAHSNGKSR